MKKTWAKRVGKIVFVFYILLVIKLVVFKMPLDMMENIFKEWSPALVESRFRSANFVPFKTISLYIHHWSSGWLNPFGNLVGNVAVFIPMGFLMPYVWEKAKNLFVCMGCGLLFVAGIEIVQLLGLLGSMDIDDVILNCSGILVGYVVHAILNCKKKNKKENI